MNKSKYQIEESIKYLPICKFIRIPSKSEESGLNQHEWINPDIIDFVQFGTKNEELIAAVSFKKICNRGLKVYRGNQAQAIKDALNKISINPLKE